MKTTNTHYVYKITNNKPMDERKYYIGVRTSEDPNNDNYWSSSKSLKESIEKIGLEHFSKEILSIWDTREEAVSEEIRLHEQFDVSTNKEFYNKVKQTSIGFDTSGLFGKDNPLFGYDFGEQFAQDVSKRQVGKGNSFYGKHHTEESKEKIREKTSGKNNHFFGKKHSDETLKIIKEKSAKGAKGKKYISNPELKLVKRVLPTELNNYVANGWVVGRMKF